MPKGSNKHVTFCKTALYEAIEEKGLTPAEVQKILGVNRDYISNLFTPCRKGDITITSALAISHILGKDLDDLIIKEPEVEEPAKKSDVDLTYINNRLSNIETELADLHKTLKSIGSIEMEMLNTIKEVWGCK